MDLDYFSLSVACKYTNSSLISYSSRIRPFSLFQFLVYSEIINTSNVLQFLVYSKIINTSNLFQFLVSSEIINTSRPSVTLHKISASADAGTR